MKDLRRLISLAVRLFTLAIFSYQLNARGRVLCDGSFHPVGVGQQFPNDSPTRRRDSGRVNPTANRRRSNTTMVDNRISKIARRAGASALLAGIIGLAALGAANSATAAPPPAAGYPPPAAGYVGPSAGYNDCLSYGGVTECWPS